MKRLLLAILILATGTTVFCAFRNVTTDIRQETLARQTAWQTQTQQLALLRFEREELRENVRAGKQQLTAMPPLPPGLRLMQQILSRNDPHNLSGDEIEQLLAEFGFNWNTTGDYLIVSKNSLAGISFEGMKGVKLTDVARAVLAITPTEQAAIESMTQKLDHARTDWAKEHVQRTEPSGNVLAQYSLPVDAEFSKSQLAVFTDGIFNTLGNERAAWLESHSQAWMKDFGIRTGQDFTKIPAELLSAIPISEYESKPTTLTVERYKSGDNWNMNYTIKQGGNSRTTSVHPRQPFPEAFKSLFPNGWADLAAREGFELPKEFQQHKAR